MHGRRLNLVVYPYIDSSIDPEKKAWCMRGRGDGMAKLAILRNYNSAIAIHANSYSRMNTKKCPFKKEVRSKTFVALLTVERNAKCWSNFAACVVLTLNSLSAH